ncbi:MAG: hypothetical protein QM699_00165 [Amaricoccus sp.]
MVLADDDFDVNTEIIWMAQDFDDAAKRGSTWLREARNLDIYRHALKLSIMSGGFVLRFASSPSVLLASASWSATTSSPSGMEIVPADSLIERSDVVCRLVQIRCIPASG